MNRFIALTFIETHTPLLMGGVNFPNKIILKTKAAEAMLDTQMSVCWIRFKGETSIVPMSNVAHIKPLISSDDEDQVFVPVPKKELPTEEVAGPIAVRRGRKPTIRTSEQPPEDPFQAYDPNDEESAAKHREAVRAASANSNKPVQTIQNDLLIQQARGQALGFKTAQVSDPTKPANGLTGVQGKPKAISHAQLKTQLAQEAKKPE